MSFIRFQEEVFEYLEGKVANFKYPKHIKFVDDLPLTPTMKVKKAALKERFTKEGEGRATLAGADRTRPI